jgi:CubicO group peptidase (beta-lactamase class C family)
MRAFLLSLLCATVAMVLWAGLVFIGTLNGWGRNQFAPAGNANAFMESARKEIRATHRGKAAFRLIENGKLHNEYFVGDSVDSETLFQVASLSKWISAWGVMTLVEAGKLDLDAPVATYLTRWSLPESEFANSKVTVRRLLSHMAGLTDGLGYAGFAPGAKVQSLEESLTHAADAPPGADGRVRVGLAPGTKWEYSGGGYTLLQLVIEEASGEAFESYMQRAVFQPLGMNRSTFAIDPDTLSNLAPLYDVDGKETAHHRFTALAAACFYTTASDMTRFIQAHLTGSNGEPAGRGVLKPGTLKLMRQPHASHLGVDIWGLGTMLYAPNGAGDFIIGHDGKRQPAINTGVRLNPSTGDGIVVLQSGNQLLATRVAGEWVFWQTGTIDFLMFTLVAKKMITIIFIGWGIIILTALVIGWRRRRGRRTRAAHLVPKAPI